MGAGVSKSGSPISEVNNMAALAFQFIRPGKGLKCRFTLNPSMRLAILLFNSVLIMVFIVTRNSKAVSISLVT